jgi:hypothetical protein
MFYSLAYMKGFTLPSVLQREDPGLQNVKFSTDFLSLFFGGGSPESIAPFESSQ